MGVLLIFLTGFGLFFYVGGPDYLSLSFLKSQLKAAQTLWDSSPVFLASLYMAVYVFVTALSLPGAAVMTLFGGAVFGLFWGTLIVSFASTFGATLSFLVARFFIHDWVKSKFRNRYDRIKQEFDRNGGFYIFSVRLVPLIPFFVANLIFGLTPVRVSTYYLASQIGMLPGTLVYVNAGRQLGQLQGVSGILSPSLIGAFLALALLPWLSKIILGFLRKRRVFSKFKRPKKFDYQVVVIGAGSAGLVAANLIATLKGKVALVEKHKMGGDCLNTGCVPSKTLIRSARLAHEMKNAHRYGLKGVDDKVDFPQVMKRVREVIHKIEPHDSVERYESLGVDCFQGEAQILSPFEIQVGSQKLTTRQIIVATGARPRRASFPGIEQVRVLDSNSIWSLEELPSRLLVLGGGAIGCELAQSFARLGSQVTLLERADRLLVKEEKEVSRLIESEFKEEGLSLYLNAHVLSFDVKEGQSRCLVEAAGEKKHLEFDFVLMALGREPNVAGFGLENLDIALRKNKTIETNEFLQTNIPNIWACGDVTGPYQFTHAAGQQGSVAALNALFAPFKKWRWETQRMPWVTFTDPEVAHMGETKESAQQKKLDFEVVDFPMERSDRALAEGSSAGFVQVLVAKGKDQILGVSIVGPHAGEMLAEFSAIVKAGKGLNHLISLIHPYPTLSEANKSAALAWKKAQTPKWVLNFLERVNKWRINA